MKDCNSDIAGYHDAKVRLPRDKQVELTSRRDANRDRLRAGLERNGNPAPLEFVTQGSRAMGTTIQEPDNKHDIDDGVVFDAADLVGSQGAEMSALDARKMVRDALDDGSFKTPPEVRKNCVRVHYNDGPHVDVPVYRRKDDGSKELASSAWRKSDPEGVTKWFENALKGKLGESAPQQMRDVIRLLKALCKNRPSYSLPSGFVLTVLVNEAYSVCDDRLDRCFRNVLSSLYARLSRSLEVRHPVVDEWLTNGAEDPKTKALRDILKIAVDDLNSLDRSNCLRSDALKAWKKVFNTDHFDADIEAAKEKERQASTAALSSLVYVPKPWGV